MAMEREWEAHMDDPTYQSFLVRLWRVPGTAEFDWRGEVENIQRGEIFAISSLDEACRLIGQRLRRELN